MGKYNKENCDSVRPEVGLLIRRRREELRISQKELAHRLGMERPNFITALESGRSKLPISPWKEYADALEIPRHKFLEFLFRTYHPDMLEYICKFCSKEPGSCCSRPQQNAAQQAEALKQIIDEVFCHSN